VTRSQPVSSSVRRAWQNGLKLRTLVTEAAVRFNFVLVQTDAANINLFHGTTMASGALVVDPSREWPWIAFAFDVIDGADVIREYAPKAKIVEVGDQVAVAGDTWGWPITIEAEYDSGIAGYTKQFYSEFATVAVPVVTSALPTAAAVTGVVAIVGTGFSTVTGVAGVKFGGTNATSYEVVSDTKIYAVMPAGTAGSAVVLVTNTGGASNSLAYTRGA